MGGVLFGLGPILALREVASPFWDVLFLAVTSTGSVPFLLAAVFLVYWLWDKRLGLFLGILLLTSGALNAYLKTLFGLPRPPTVYHKTLVPLTSNGFPSGHAQAAAVFWSGMALVFRGIWIPVAAAVVFAVAFSRVYLGVHFVGDVLGGAAIGVVLAVVGFLGYRASFWKRLTPLQKAIVAWLAPTGLALVLLALGEDPYLLWGLLTGLAVGYVLEGEWVGMARPKGADAIALRVVVGLFALAALSSIGLQLVHPVLVLTYFHLLGLLVAFALPWVFVRVEDRLRRANR
ncbi:MAG: phosphatase PAP2 family protein [Thermoplasmata archaeon]|nr:phosphatase PAP2 family protein [Thermoplasmata archaeon]